MARSGIYPPSVQPGKPRLGAIPEGWTTYRFADLFDVIERPAKLLDDTEYQLITARRSRGGVIARERLLGKDILTKTQFYVEEDDFVISNRQIIHGGCGIVPAALDGAVVSNEYTVLRPKSVLLLDYLRYLPHTTFLQQTFFHASVGVDVEKMVFDLDQWLGFKVHLPPILEQGAITEILTSVDEAIAATKTVIDQTRIVKQGVMNRLLTKGIGHTRFKQTEIGEIPESWTVQTLSDVTQEDRPITYGIVQAGPDTPEGIPYIRVSDMGDREISEERLLRTTQDIALKYKRSSVAAGDIVFALRGKIGHVLPVPSSLEGANLTQGTARIAIRKGIHSCYMLWALRSTSSVSQIMNMAKGSTFVEISLGNLKRVKVPVPAMDEQVNIANSMQLIDGRLAADEAIAHQVISLKESLMSDLLTGRKRVPT